MNDIVASLQVFNAFDHPKQNELLLQELGHMSQRLEEGPDYTEEDELLVHAFEGEYHTYEGAGLKWVGQTVANLSEDFPQLVFALDVKSNGVDDLLPHLVIRREYYFDGQRQIVFPYQVIPDFDPECEFEGED